MEVKNYFAFTAENKPIPFCTAYLYEAGTTNLVSGLKDKNGNPIDNPFSADKDGLAQFSGPNGNYDLRFKSSLRDYRIRITIIDTEAILNAAENIAASEEFTTAEANRSEDGAERSEQARDEALQAVIDAQSNSRTVSTWTTLLGITGGEDGEGAEVIDTDTGTHSAASGTGYDGSTVSNAGRYSWNDSWSRWVRIGDTGLSAKADKTELAALDETLSTVESEIYTAIAEKADQVDLEALDAKVDTVEDSFAISFTQLSTNLINTQTIVTENHAFT